MSNSIEKVGFVGFGPMGQLMARNMFQGAEIEFVDPGLDKVPDNIAAIQTDRAMNFAFGDVDAAVLTVPASAIDEAALEVVTSPGQRKHWPEDIQKDHNFPLIVDPCSVKMFPQAIIERIDPGYPELLHCHPLFGPQSASKSVDGKTVIVTKKVGEKADNLLGQWEKLGLKILEMSAEEHDERMAMIQAIPFALGRIANDLEIGLMRGSGLETTSFEAAMSLADLDGAHSDELFRTIMEFNPFAQQALHRIELEVSQMRARVKSGQHILHSLGLI